MKRLPPFFALRALEAAARHKSYSRAADELAVTHGAVSQQIRRLEAELSARLFERRGNAMIPTPAAERLARGVRRGLDTLHEALSEFSGSDEHDPLVVSIDPQFATRWLPPRLPRLLADAAGANLEIRVEERCVDLVTEGVDLGIRYGGGEWDGVEGQRLIPEVLFPVCNPKLAALYPMQTARDLLNAPLLHHAHRPWSLWFETFGLTSPEPQGLIFDDALMAYEAAAQGLGVVLGRATLIEDDLKTGRLIPAGRGEIVTERGYFAVWRGDNRKLARIRALIDWICAEAAPAVTLHRDTCRAA